MEEVMTMSRRTFLKTSGGAVIAAGIVGAIEPLKAVADPWRPLKNRPAGDKLKGEEAEILRLASLAPSGHNTQPWTVQIVKTGHWVIGTDRGRWLPAVDPHNREVMLSLGAFLENLVIAAGVHGYGVDYRVIAKSGFDRDVIDVRLKKGAGRDFPVSLIEKRRTLRNGMGNGDIRTGDYAILTDGLTATAEYFSRNSSRGRLLAERTIEANRVQAWREPAQQELADWIRWSDADVKKYRNGLTPASMEITGFAGWYVRTFFNRSSVLSKSFRERGVEMVKKQVENCGGWIVLGGDDSVSTLVETGRSFQ
ncbi:MAG TPA: twin-arginine translocation signal domain-containing protein, partial [Spirochaetes bacterium]|nr:twin-arginine translocation signal domain-containing protein [Spirochaetota bacterium]